MPLTGGFGEGGVIGRALGQSSSLTRWARLNAIVDDLRAENWDVTGSLARSATSDLGDLVEDEIGELAVDEDDGDAGH